MKFDINRLSILAGIGNSSTSQTGSSNKQALNEAQNRSYHEDPGFSEAELAYINQLNEEDEDDGDIVLEINEAELRREILAMRKQRDQTTLAEAQLRKEVRKEVRHILDEIDLNISNGWVYGNNKPRNSRKGKVARGFMGIGFK
jgi:hypothetical protein